MNKIKINESELKTLIKKVLSEYKTKLNESNLTVEVEMETENGSQFTIAGELSYEDHGIGSYEFWGQSARDTQYYLEVEDYHLIENSYNEEDLDDINQWINQNEDKIKEELLSKAEQDYDPDDVFYPYFD